MSERLGDGKRTRTRAARPQYRRVHARQSSAEPPCCWRELPSPHLCVLGLSALGCARCGHRATRSSVWAARHPLTHRMDRRTQVDTALALCKEVQTILRPELRLLVMSATLGPTLIDSLTTLLRPEPAADAATDTLDANALRAPLVRSKGRSYPLTTHYAGAPAVGRGEMERCACPHPLPTFATRCHPRCVLPHALSSGTTLGSIWRQPLAP